LRQGGFWLLADGQGGKAEIADSNQPPAIGFSTENRELDLKLRITAFIFRFELIYESKPLTWGNCLGFDKCFKAHPSGLWGTTDSTPVKRTAKRAALYRSTSTPLRRCLF